MVRTEIPASTIAGGFVLVPVGSLLACWRACRSPGGPGVGAFRAWLGCLEMRTRRCLVDGERSPTFDFPELARLLGVNTRTARLGVRQLVAGGLLEWSESAIGFPEAANQAPGPKDSIGRGLGAVAIPRRILRFLANGARPALIATVLGLLLRCLSRRRGGFDSRGRIKASWVARVFQVDLRRVREARAELLKLGWIDAEATDQRAENQWGRAYRINLGWDRPRPADGRRLPPSGSAEPSPIALPSVDQEPLPGGIRNQEPARPGAGTGFRCGGRGDENTAQARTQAGTGATPLPAPRLTDIRPEDLRDTARTLVLFGQAVERKLIGSSENDRLKFLALAEYACEIGTVNPGGLMASLMHRGAWHFATQAEEDAARRKLREHLRGARDTLPPVPQPSRGFIADPPKVEPRSLGNALAGLMGRFGGLGSGV
jgi:hypothetical protein